jgi:hypothetical protein
MGLTMKMAAFSDVTPDSQVNVYRHFSGGEKEKFQTLMQESTQYFILSLLVT